MDRSKDLEAQASCINSQISIEDSVISTFSKPQGISNRGNQGSLRHNPLSNLNPQHASDANLNRKSYRKTSTIGNPSLRLTKPSIYVNNVGFPNNPGSCDFSSSEEDQYIAPKRVSPSDQSRHRLSKTDSQLYNTVSTNYYQNPTGRKISGLSRNFNEYSHHNLSKQNSLNSSLLKPTLASHKNIRIPASTNDTSPLYPTLIPAQMPLQNPGHPPKKRNSHHGEKKFSQSQISSGRPKELGKYSNSVLLGRGGIEGLRGCQWDSISNGISSPGHGFGVNGSKSQCQVESDEVESDDGNGNGKSEKGRKDGGRGGGSGVFDFSGIEVDGGGGRGGRRSM